MFTSGCQFGYSIQSNNGAHLSPGSRPCTLSLSSIEFDAQSSYSKDFEVPTYATQGDYWPFTDGYLPPGEYVLLAGLLDGSGEIPWARSHFRVVAR